MRVWIKTLRPTGVPGRTISPEPQSDHQRHRPRRRRSRRVVGSARRAAGCQGSPRERQTAAEEDWQNSKGTVSRTRGRVGRNALGAGSSYFRNLDVLRSAKISPFVWQVGQYCSAGMSSPQRSLTLMLPMEFILLEDLPDLEHASLSRWCRPRKSRAVSAGLQDEVEPDRLTTGANATSSEYGRPIPCRPQVNACSIARTSRPLVALLSRWPR